MAFNFPKLPEFGTKTNARSRLLYIVIGVIGIIVLGYVMVSLFGGTTTSTGPSKVVNPTGSLQSIPGGQTSSAYYQTLAQANLQATEKAQMTGGSAVPTLVNIPGQPTNFGQNVNCTVLCPGEDGADVTNDINDLVKQGKLTQQDADALIALAKSNVPVEQYAAALDALVKQGKLTPEQARKLLDTYKKQHANNLLADNAKSMDALIKSGQLPLDVANDLLNLQKKNPSVAEYSAELARLVKEGKISPAVAAQLLAQYTQQKQKELAKQGAFDLDQMAKQGEITPQVANALKDMQSKNIPVDQYAAQLNQLVAQGKLTPAAAAKLLDQYKNQRLGVAQTGALAQLMSEGGPKADEAKRLLALQGNNAPLSAYADELKRAVQQGLISPDMAAQLMQEYRASLASLSAPGPEVAIPGADDFAKLQQQLQKEAVVPTTPAQGTDFAAAQAQAEADDAAAREQRVQQLEAAMSGQAQQLITAWQPQPMQHKVGQEEVKASQKAAAGTTASTTTKTTSTTTEAAPTGPSLIKAGTILFAVLDTGVDSDYPDSPVMATIVQGEFKGAKLLGKIQVGKGPSKERVSLVFNLMSMDNWPTNKTVNAFAIDPDTARTVLASDVDHHYATRYGAIMATSFLSGYANAIMSAGSTTTTGIFGTTSVRPEFSPGNKLAIGLGQIGTSLNGVVQNYANIPATVKVNSGVGLGILYMDDVVS